MGEEGSENGGLRASVMKEKENGKLEFDGGESESESGSEW